LHLILPQSHENIYIWDDNLQEDGIIGHTNGKCHLYTTLVNL